MIIKRFSQFYPSIPLKKNAKLTKSLETNVKGKPGTYMSMIQNVMQSRLYIDKDKIPKDKLAKKEAMTVKMPGFVHPETLHEEGYFTQKGKRQLEEIKRKGADKPNLSNPEKKE